MRKRLFIAINLPEGVKEELARLQSMWPELGAKWTKKNNLHITLFFLGPVVEQKIPELLKIMEETVQSNKAFEIKFDHVVYGPPKKKPPRMIWANLEESEELLKLHKDLKQLMLNSGSFSDTAAREKRDLSPHITLARLNMWEFRQMEPEEIPYINEKIGLAFKVNSIELMESQLKRSGAEYTTLQSYSLK
jgi:2'-5' RNA ligase